MNEKGFFKMLEDIFIKAVESAVIKVLQGDVIDQLVETKALPEFLTATEAMQFLKIKSIKTFDKKMDEFKIRVHFNRAKNNLKCYKRSDIVNIYMTSQQMILS